MFFLYKPVQLVQSKKVLLKDPKFGQVFEEKVIREKGQHSNKADLYFINKKNKYIWDETIQMFRKLRNVDESLNQSDFHKMIGLEPNEVKERLKMFGLNIIKISVPPVLHLIIHEVFCYNDRICENCANIPCAISAGAESVLPVSILHRDPVDPAVVLEVRPDHRCYDRHYRNALRLGGEEGEGDLVMKCKYLLTVTISLQQNRNLRDTMKSESKMRVVRNNRGK